MYEFVRGKLIEASSETAIIDVQGVGYQINIPANVCDKMGQTGGEVLLYTSFIVRENAHTLHGFMHKKERDVFEILLTVTGIGPKIAMQLLGHLSLNQLIEAVKQQQVKLLRVPGVGKKTAERLVLELRDKLLDIGLIEASDVPSGGMRQLQSPKMQDAISALVNLGYTQLAAQKAVLTAMEEVEEEFELTELISAALKKS